MPVADAPARRAVSPRVTRVWLLGPTLVVAGLLAHGLLSQLPWERFGLSLLLAMLASAGAWPLVRWARCSWASALVLPWAAALLLFVGLAPLMAALVLAAAATALGLRLVPKHMPGRLGIAAVSGLAIIGGLAGWMLGWPVHHRATWIVLLALLAASGWRHLAVELREARAAWRAQVAASPRGMACAVMLLGLASTGTWLPTMQMDDLTYHLNLPAQLLLHARYEGAPAHGIWAFAPWFGDIVQAIVGIVAGRESRGAVNAFWLLALAMTVAATMRTLRASAGETSAALALIASFPPLVWLAAGMQTELPAAAILFALVAVIWADDVRGRLLVGTILLAALCALKLTHALTALPLLLVALWRTRQALPWKRWPLALALLCVLAGASYAMSWLHTRNPVFPLFNAYFRSPLHPLENFSDSRWHAGLDVLLPWQLSFTTSSFVESWDGGLGFSLIGLAGAWLLALRRGRSRSLAIAAAVAFALPLLPMQYARYAYPGILLLVAPCLAGSQAAVGSGRVWRWSIVGLCVLNLAFQANSGWTHHSAALKRTIRTAGDSTQVTPHYVAERALMAALPSEGIVLATDPARGYVAELGGRGRVVSEHAPALSAARSQAEQDPSGEAWRVIFAQTDAQWLLVTNATASPALRAALSAPGFKKVNEVGGVTLWRRAPSP